MLLKLPLRRPQIAAGEPCAAARYPKGAASHQSSAGMRALRGIFVLVLVTTAACTRYEYSKPNVTEAAMANDFNECAEIARHEAFRDPRSSFRGPHVHGGVFHDRTIHHLGRDSLSFGELRHRYHRVCMLARGYELTPVPEQ